MFIELFEKYRLNTNNIASYYPYDDTRIILRLFKPMDENGKSEEILMCGNKETRNAVLERLDEICEKQRMVQVSENQGIKLE